MLEPVKQLVISILLRGYLNKVFLDIADRYNF